MTFRLCTIGDFVQAGFASIQTGPFGTQLKASEYVAEGIPVINVRNIGYSDLRADKIEYVTENKAVQLGVHRIGANDIVFGRKGAVDRHLYVQAEHEGWVQGSDCIRLRIESVEINSRYISYAMLSAHHKKWMLNQCGNKATMASLNQDVVKRIPLAMPARPIQDEIAAILSAYDNLIENNRRRIALLEEAARQLYKEWFVRFRFPGHEHVEVIDGVPEGWERVELGSVCDLKWGDTNTTKDSYKNEGFDAYSAKGLDGKLDHFDFERNGIVISAIGAQCGKTWIARGKWSCIKNTMRMFPTRKQVSVEYLYYATERSDYWQRRGGAQPFISQGDARGLPIMLPPITLACQFEELSSSSLNLASNLAEQNLQLAKARDLLLPKLMSGAITV